MLQRYNETGNSKYILILSPSDKNVLIFRKTEQAAMKELISQKKREKTLEKSTLKCF